MIAELGGLDAARRQLADVEVIAASDVEYPLLGPWGTARVFAPQKGADMATVAVLEGRLAAWAIELDAAAGRGVSAEPGAGAAGGIGAGLLAVGGRYQSGAAIIAEHTHFADDLADAELIVTGEGRFDEQSLHGKVVGAIAAAARPLAIPVIVLAGRCRWTSPRCGRRALWPHCPSLSTPVRCGWRWPMRPISSWAWRLR